LFERLRRGERGGTYCWVQAQCFVDGAVEVRDVCYVVAVEVGFPGGDSVNYFAELGLCGRVLAELVG
jgi:hypothetical protein